MMFQPLTLVNFIPTAALIVLLAGCASDGSVTSGDPTVAPPMTMRFEQGQLMSVISVASKAGEAAAAARKTYATQAFGLAKDFGLTPLGALPVVGVGAGSFQPNAVAFYAWSSEADEQRFSEQPAWAPIKATRPDGWDELRVHDVVLDRDLTLNFKTGKRYSMATAWLNPDKPYDYDRYLANIESQVASLGGRFIYQMKDPSFASITSGDEAPDRLTFVEWDTADGLERFQRSQGFKDNVALLQSGTVGFEIVLLALPKG